MKRITVITVIASAIAALASCQKQDDVRVDREMQDLKISFTGNEITVGTKANGIGNEDKINTAQLMLFNASGELYRYHSLSASEISAMTVTVANVKIGTYSVALVANGPANLGNTVTTLDGLKTMQLNLKTYNVTGTGFVMWATGSATVTADATATVNLELKRHVGRVVVSKITNSLPASMGSLTINNIMLTNVYANVTMEGNAPSSGVLWYNMEGRSDTGSLSDTHIIDGGSYLSQCGDLTFKAVGSSVANGASYSTVQRFYGYRNTSTATPDSFVASYPSTGYRSCIVVTATFNGHKWYYPVILDSFAAHTTYDVQLTIIGEGSTDPNIPVRKGSVKANITVADWTVGTAYNKTI